jgi:hypothetical protein
MPRPLLLLLPLAAGVLAAGVLAAPPVQEQTCRQFRTCADAVKALEAGNRQLDRDGDGIPCETPCRACRPPAAPNQGRQLLPQARAAIAADAERWGA